MGLVLALSRLLLDQMVSTIKILFSDLCSAFYANSDYGKFGCKFLSSSVHHDNPHPLGPDIGPLQVTPRPHGLYHLDPVLRLVHFEINDLVISTEFF